QFVAVPQCAPHDTTQDVTPAFVAGNDAIDNEEAASTDVVGYDLERIVFQIPATSFTRCGGNEVADEVDFVIGMLVLQNRGNTLQTHAGVNAGLRQRGELATRIAVELHEDQVPDFDVAVAIFLGRTGRASPDTRTMVVENFRARAARACIGHLPEVVGGIGRALVVTDADDTSFGNTDFLGPNIVGFVVVLIHRYPEFFFRELIDLGQEFPRILDGVTLEVVSETEITQHFEESVVPCCITYVFEVIMLAAGPHAALRSRRADVGTRLSTSEDILKPHHTGIGEQPGGIITRYARRRGNDLVALRLEKRQKLLTDFGGLHCKMRLVHAEPIIIRDHPIHT